MNGKIPKYLYSLLRSGREIHCDRTIIRETRHNRLTFSRQFGCQSTFGSTVRQLTTSSTTSNSNPPTGHRDKPTSSSVDQDEVDKFSRIAKSWWDVMGDFRALHNMNELRVPLIRDAMLEKAQQSDVVSSETRPLKGVNILDVGCGGGILSEPLARLGAQVVGIDASTDNIAMAEWHAKLDKRLSDCLHYKCCAVEDLSASDNHSYDAVVASEIVEHVANPEDFTAACCNLVKPGGSVFITTLNKTWMSYAFGVVAAERILRIVPAGAHDWEKFVTPSTLQSWLSHNGFRTVLVHGMALNPLSQRWSWTRNTSISYALHAVRSETAD